jgi:hypothetical protein
MTSPLLPKIDMTRITPVSLAYRPAKAVLGFRNGNQMHVVRHQAVRPYFDTAFTTPFGHKLDIVPIIIIAEKCILPAIASLGYMMGIMLYNYSCDTGHD